MVALGVFVLYYSFQSVSILVVRDKTTGEEIFSRRISPGEEFKLSYIHSVEKILVTGVFTVDEDFRIILLETYFPSYGIGLPTEAHPDRESGQLILKGINEPRELSFFSLSINDYRLIFGEDKVPLSPTERDGHIIEILARGKARIVWMIEKMIEPVYACLGNP